MHQNPGHVVVGGLSGISKPARRLTEPACRVCWLRHPVQHCAACVMDHRCRCVWQSAASGGPAPASGTSRLTRAPPARPELSSVAALAAGPGYETRKDRVQTLRDLLHACSADTCAQNLPSVHEIFVMLRGNAVVRTFQLESNTARHPLQHQDSRYSQVGCHLIRNWSSTMPGASTASQPQWLRSLCSTLLAS